MTHEPSSRPPQSSEPTDPAPAVPLSGDGPIPEGAAAASVSAAAATKKGGSGGGRAARGTAAVAAGILSSRIVGLVRERLLAGYFGTGLHADVLTAGFKMPNVVQNLLGEGTLSASFIPVYSELLGQGRRRDAGRVAGAVFALLTVVAAAISLLGMAAAPLLVTVFTPGFEGERRELLIAVTRILFPMTGVLVLSAWALGVLNSHRSFFMPYFAPVLWNGAIIAALLIFSGSTDLDGLLMAAAWGALAGGALQLAVQWPWVWRFERELGARAGFRMPEFRRVVRNAGPAIFSRGIVQLGGYLDLIFASLLAIGAFSRLRFAQTLYLLPVALFGMSVAAAALPELARRRGEQSGALRNETVAAVRRVALLAVPSVAAFVLLGDVFVAGLYQTGEFGRTDVLVVWAVLAAYSAGLLASTASRVYQSAYFALQDTRTPARIAVVRIGVSAAAGALLMVQFESIEIFGVGLPAGIFGGVSIDGVPLGPVGLALGATLGAWVEREMLVRGLRPRLGGVNAGASLLLRLVSAALAAAAAGHGLRVLFRGTHPLGLALAVALVFGVVYFAAAWWFRVTEARDLLTAMHRKLMRAASRA